jgi:acyl-CoA thioester hydrolase
MTSDAPLSLHQETVRAEWIDYNGHMSEAFYVLVFGNATDALYDHIGLDADYRTASGCSAYTVEAHIHYLHEVAPGSALRCETRILGFDAKRLHIHHDLFADDVCSAAIEIMALHYDTAAGRVIPLPADIHRRLAGCPSGPPPQPASRALAIATTTAGP